MANDQKGDRGRDGGGAEPFRQSGSGEDYSADANWGAERLRDNPGGGNVEGMEGAASGAGDGGFGPEGDYGGAAGAPNAGVLGQVNADSSRLADEAHNLGKPKPGRATTGGNDADQSE